MANGFISKTAFLKFEQCQKAFFLYKNHYYLKDKLSTDKKLTFKRGHDVGTLAQQLFPGGINVVETDSNKERAIAYTKQLIENKTEVIYEATFVFNEVLVMVDILVLSATGYFAYEVKSSLKVSETFIKDACLQYHVLKNNLNSLVDFYVVTLNESYEFTGELEIKKLFKKRSILKDAQKNEAYFIERIAQAHLLLDQNTIPNIDIGKQCFSPYECDFFQTCWKNTISDDSVFTLGKIGKDELFNWYHNGIKNISDIKDVSHLSSQLQIQISSSNEKRSHVDAEGIKSVLSAIKAPYAAIDMEIWGQAVPVMKGTKPFQKVPFLFTLFTEAKGSHFFFDFEEDDRRLFAVTLIEHTKAFKTLLVYDKSLERLIINELAELYKDLRNDLLFVSSKLLDVSEIIHKQYYYHYLLKGNYSLKAVSKVVLDENVFEDENIFTGLEAMNAFVNFRATENIIEKQAIKDDLINYCQADTKATFMITKKFQELITAV